MNRLLLQIFMLLLLCGTAWAQTRTVSGKVTDKSGEALVGVSLLVKGTQQGASTDVNGAFKINLQNSSNIVLVVRYLGFATQEVAVAGNQAQVNITLVQNAATTLNEVQVVNIGYGTVSRNALTGSVSSVNAKQLKDIPVNSTAEALAGRLAGVQITQSEGSPNTQATIKVRGGASITLNSSPLYVVDGVQVEDALNVIAPQDIESIDVLKDASSTAIYGARGSNGVVLITTKGGRAQKPTVTYNGLVGVRQLRDKLDVLNPYDFVKYQHERALLNGTTELNSFINQYGFYSDLDLYKQAPFVDWQDQMFGRNALMQTHNLSLTGGTETTKYNLSVTSNGEEGIQLGSDFDRKIVNFKFDQKISDRLSAGATIRFNTTEVNGAGTSDPGSSSTNRLRQSVRYRPLISPGGDLLDYDPDYLNQTNGNGLSLVNPLLLNQAEYRRNNSNVVNLSGNVTYNITKLLAFKTTFGYDYTNTRADAFNDIITSVARQFANMPTASIGTQTRRQLNNSNVLTFNMDKSNSKFSKRNSLNVLLGQEIFDDLRRGLTIESRYFPVGISAQSAINSFSLAAVPANLATTGSAQPLPVSFEETNRILSFFGRVNYSFDNKYLLTASVRGDGSSKFAPGYKWGYFPAFSAAWRISEEKFFAPLKSSVDDVKFRINYGQSANNRVDNFLYLPLFTANNTTYSTSDQLVAGFRPVSLANNRLTWETLTSRGLGLDFSLFKNRLQVSADVYSNRVDDLLVSVSLPVQSGYDSQYQNTGSISNKGVEVQLNATPVLNKTFGWTINFNMSYNQNKVLSIGPGPSFRTVASGWAGGAQPNDFLLQVGKPVGVIYGLVNDGFYKVDDFNFANGVYTLKQNVPSSATVSVVPQPGTIKYKDLNNDGVVTADDRTELGSAQPKFFGGLNQQFTYKNLDLSVFVNYQLGNKVLNANKLEFTSGYTPGANLLSEMNGRFRNVDDNGVRVTDPAALAALNANATIWSPINTANSFFVNSYSVESGSFLRINNITLGYTFPAKILKLVHINRLRVYGTVNNLAVITGYSGYDPEVNTRRNSPLTPGVDYSAYPRSRALIFGVNLTL